MTATNICYFCMETKTQPSPSRCNHCGVHDDELVIYPGALIAGSELQNCYLIGRVLGSGRFANTYMAYDTQRQARRVIKEYMPKEWASRMRAQRELRIGNGPAAGLFAKGLKAFLEEAQLLTNLENQTSPANVIYFFRENQTAYIVMEYVEGTPLSDYVQRTGGKLSVQETFELLNPLMQDLDAAHRRGLLHGDLHPDSLFRAYDGALRILGFNAARRELAVVSQSPSTIWQPGYAAPEWFRKDGKIGPWSDVYSLAAIIYRLLTGTVPQDAWSRLDQDELEAPSTLGVKLDTSAEQALLKALSVKPTERYKSVSDFLRGLSRTSIEQEALNLLAQVMREQGAGGSARPTGQPKNERSNERSLDERANLLRASISAKLQEQSRGAGDRTNRTDRMVRTGKPADNEERKHVRLLFATSSIYTDIALPWLLMVELLKYFLLQHHPPLADEATAMMTYSMYVGLFLFNIIVLILIYYLGKWTTRIKWRAVRRFAYLPFIVISLHLLLATTYYHYKYFVWNEPVFADLHLTFWYEPLYRMALELAPNLFSMAGSDLMVVGVLSFMYCACAALIRFYLFSRAQSMLAANMFYFAANALLLGLNLVFAVVIGWLPLWFLAANGVLFALMPVAYAMFSRTRIAG